MANPINQIPEKAMDENLGERTQCQYVRTDTGNRCVLQCVVGQKYCVNHGGGRGYASFLGEGELSACYIAFTQESDQLTLYHELALQRTMLAGVVKKIAGAKLDGLAPSSVAAIIEITKEIAKTVKAIAFVQNSLRDTIHVEDVKMVVDGIIEIVKRYIPDPEIQEKIAYDFQHILIPTNTNYDSQEEIAVDARKKFPIRLSKKSIQEAEDD